MFEVECQILPIEADLIVVKATATSKKQAKANAAKEMLDIIQNGLTVPGGRVLGYSSGLIIDIQLLFQNSFNFSSTRTRIQCI